MMLLLGRPPAYHKYSRGQHGSTGASQKASFDRESIACKWRRMRWAGGQLAGRRCAPAALHHGCVSRRQPRHMGTACSILSPASLSSMAHGISISWRRLGYRIGMKLAFALLGTGARRTATLLACLWRIGRRPPTRRRAVSSSITAG